MPNRSPVPGPGRAILVPAMRILIAGGGQVGALIARRLIREGNEITIVDPSPDRCAELESQLDARVVQAARLAS